MFPGESLYSLLYIQVTQTSFNFFHPLTELTFQWTNCHDHATINFNDPQPVLLNGNIYMKGDKLNGQHRIWKYVVSTKLFSEILTPSDINDKYLLTTYNSHLHLIDINFADPVDPSDIEEDIDAHPEVLFHQLCVCVWEFLNESKWERSKIIPSYFHRSGDPQSEDYLCSRDDYSCRPSVLEPQYWDIFATTKDDYLMIAFYRRDEMLDDHDLLYDCFYGIIVSVDILLYNGYNNSWKCVQGTNFNQNGIFMTNDDDDELSNCTVIDRPSTIINDDTVYVKLWSEDNYKDDGNYCALKRIPLNNLLDRKTYSRTTWQELPSLKLPTEHSNLSVLDNQLIVGISRQEQFVLLALCTRPNDAWIEITHVDAEFDSTPCIVGLPDSSLLIIGMVNQTSAGTTPALNVLKITSQGM